ncbi:DUF4080 domain-containing protein [bacterium]|nr:DUF4080 domain-containing protein [bacterium]
MLQLGFLKMLKGTPLRESYEALYSDAAPYEVISTPYMSKADFAELKKVESVTDRLYNSGKFYYYLQALNRRGANAYDSFLNIAEYLSRNNIRISAAENDINAALLDYADCNKNIKDILRFDYMITNNSRKIPAALKVNYTLRFKNFLKDHTPDRYTMYAEFNYLPVEDVKGYFIVKFDYSGYDKVKRIYCYEIIESVIDS